MTTRWQPGDQIVRREVWHGRAWSALPMYVVRDSIELLALYMPVGTPIGFGGGPWPTANGRHGWDDGPDTVWLDHDVLQLHRPGDPYSAWILSPGADREDLGWYLNLQRPFRRTPIGIDTLDHELDVVINEEGDWRYKDVEELHASVELGRFTSAEVADIEALGDRLTTIIEAGVQWWDDRWKNWSPQPEWSAPLSLPADWDDMEAASADDAVAVETSSLVE